MRHVAQSFSLSLLVFLLLLPSAIRAEGTPAEAKPVEQDVLIYRDGDRIQGKIISNDGTTIVFQSKRFGFLRVPTAQAEAVSATGSVANQNQPEETNSGPVESDYSLRRIHQAVRNFFGPWHGRFAFSAEVVSDSDHRRNDVLESRFERKWSQEELRLEARYEFSSTNDNTSTDMLKSNAYWRHDLTHRWFLFYRPSFEWNQNYNYEGTPADYRLLTNEVGVGFYIIRREGGFIRCGLSENFFNVWTDTPIHYLNDNNEAAFVEGELQLPWEIRITGRGVRYFYIAGGASGWERQFELTKKLTTTLSLGLRHESRHNTPDRRVQDYNSWRTLVGLDF